MARVMENHLDCWIEPERLFIRDWLKERQSSFGIGYCVKGLKRVFALAQPFFVDVLHVLFLQVARIRKHDAAKIAGGTGCVNGSPEAVLHQSGQISAMVDMCVGEKNRVDCIRPQGEIAVPLKRLLSLSLNKTAVKENPAAIGLKKMH